MMLTKKLLRLFLLFCLQYIDASPFKLLKSIASEKALKQLTKSVNGFSIELFQQIIEDNENNVVSSPFGVDLLLSALFYGARGKTAEEINQTLHYQDMTLEDVATGYHDIFIDGIAAGYEMRVYKAMFFRNGYKIDPNFGEIAGVLFMVEGKMLDFTVPSSVELVNDYARNGTRGAITKFFDTPLDPSTLLLLVSATYFRGIWQTAFDPKNTRFGLFYSSGKNVPKNVLMMNVVSNFQYVDDDELQAEFLKIPYHKEEGDMILVLPRSKKGLQTLEQELTIKSLEKTLEAMTSVEANVTIPKFAITSSFALKPLLQKMGIKKAFQAKRADFFGIVGIEGMSLSNVNQKNTIEVSEEGTLASSAGIVRPRRAGIIQTHFVANRPFLYFVKDRRSDIIFFIGHVLDL